MRVSIQSTRSNVYKIMYTYSLMYTRDWLGQTQSRFTWPTHWYRSVWEPGKVKKKHTHQEIIGAFDIIQSFMEDEKLPLEKKRLVLDRLYGYGVQIWEPDSTHAIFCSIHGTIIRRRSGNNLSMVSRMRRHVFGKSKKILQLISHMLGNLNSLGTRRQGMLKEREAATAARDCMWHATKLTK